MTAALSPFNTEEGVVVDTCTQCRAVWFDHSELASMAGTRDDLPSLQEVQDHVSATTLPCPRCTATTLVEMPYASGQPLKIATCPTCQGVLSSLSDLGAIRATAASARMIVRRESSTSNTDLVQTAETSILRVADRFADYRRLSVKQRRSWFEMLTGFEQANRYTVLANGMGAAFVVQEQSHGIGEVFIRLFLGPWRPFESYVEDTRRGTLAMKLVRPFRWFFPELLVNDAHGTLLARIVRRWRFFVTHYEIFDARGRLLGEIHGPFFRPWTFEINANGRRVALVKKVWSGLFKEALTDADNFEVTFEDDAPAWWKPIGMACAVLIDVVHFERSNG
jgi:Zn-finger nucleic acid-binding protein/uncharacterized protein YxjI